ncbi:MAG TPA: CvpA family protein, partial [Gammaproteobacteria bacterium]|nr:CvpA family protein [Gammaproteobacteria bacterium]
WADIAIVLICVLSAIFGLWRGLAQEALSLATWLAAIFLAWRFTWLIEPLLVQWIAQPELRTWTARAVIFVLVIIAGGLVAWVVRELIRHTGLGGTDRLLGGLFGFARGVLIVGLAVIALQLTGLDQDPWWQHARLKPYSDRVAAGIRYYGSLGRDLVRDQRSA